MVRHVRGVRAWLLISVIVVIMPSQASAQPSSDGAVPSRTQACWHPWGARASLDQDFLQRLSNTSDQNYTMGLGFEVTGPWLAPVGDPIARRLGGVLRRLKIVPARFTETDTLRRSAARLDCADAKAGYAAERPPIVLPPAPTRDNVTTTPGSLHYALLAGTAFTPGNLRAPLPVLGDRPYAFVLGLTMGRVWFPDRDAARSYTTELTVGTLGSRLGRNVQRSIHAWRRAATGDTNPADPKGWGSQISNGAWGGAGIPVVRVSVEHERRVWELFDTPNKDRRQGEHRRVGELVVSGQGELGYYTTAALGVRGRIGVFQSRFYEVRSTPLAGQSRGSLDAVPDAIETFVFAGVRERAVIYNALLQGWLGPRSAYTLSAEDIERLYVEGEIGMTTVIRYGPSRRRELRATYTLDAFRGPEFKSTRYAREHHWGGLALAVMF